MKTTVIRKSAKGQDCTLQIHPYCNGDPDTTVLCHINCDGKGLSIKSPDWWAAYGCSDCHDIIDGRRMVELPPQDIIDCVYRGLYRTQKLLIDQGLIKIKGVNL